MGILILFFIGTGIGGAGVYWAYGAKVSDEDWLSKPIHKLQKAFDERAKERGASHKA